MGENPDSAIPHNLLGICYENQGRHVEGMKHFRAAWALEPAFIPARWNMDFYGGLEKSTGNCAYMPEDVSQEIHKTAYHIVYDDKGIGHVIKEE